MEVLLDKIYNAQLDLEDDLLLECSWYEAKETDDGRKLIRFFEKETQNCSVGFENARKSIK